MSKYHNKEEDWSISKEEDWSISKAINNIEYQETYSRWPKLDVSLLSLTEFEFSTIAWEQYAKLLDNGRGMREVLCVQRQVESEIVEIEHQLEKFPEDAYSYFKTRLDQCLTLLLRRRKVLNRLLTTYTVQGEVVDTPDFELDENKELTPIEKQAVHEICRSAKKRDKKKILTEYLILNRDQVKADIKEIILTKYEVSESGFYKWVNALEEEIQRISGTEK